MKKCLSVVSVAQTVKNLLAVQETWVRSLVWEDPLEKGMAIHSSIRGSHGQRSLADCSPWGRKESGVTEWPTLPVGWLTALRCLRWFTVLRWQWTLNPVVASGLCSAGALPSLPLLRHLCPAILLSSLRTSFSPEWVWAWCSCALVPSAQETFLLMLFFFSWPCLVCL